MRRLDNQQGITLIELIIGMALMVIILTGILNVLITAVESYHYNDKRTFEVQQARKVMNELAQDIRTANSINQPDKGSAAASLTYTRDAKTYRVALGTGGEERCIVRNNERLTANVVDSLQIERDPRDARLMTLTVVFNSGEKDSSSGFKITTKVFSPNLLP